MAKEPLGFHDQMRSDMRGTEGPAERFEREPDLCCGVADFLAFAANHQVDRGADLFRDPFRRVGGTMGAG
jgi:hypothetical protein